MHKHLSATQVTRIYGSPHTLSSWSNKQTTPRYYTAFKLVVHAYLNLVQFPVFENQKRTCFTTAIYQHTKQEAHVSSIPRKQVLQVYFQLVRKTRNTSSSYDKILKVLNSFNKESNILHRQEITQVSQIIYHLKMLINSQIQNSSPSCMLGNQGHTINQNKAINMEHSQHSKHVFTCPHRDKKIDTYIFQQLIAASSS